MLDILCVTIVTVAMVTGSADGGVTAGLTEGGNAVFTHQLYTQITQTKPITENILTSPLSVQLAMYLALLGASGGTYDEIRSGLGLQEGDKLMTLTGVAHGLEEILKGKSAVYNISTANGIFVSDEVLIEGGVEHRAADLFSAVVENVDFTDPETLDLINDWVSGETNGALAEFLDYIDPGVKMILLNAIYFESSWDQPFSTRFTRQRPFYFTPDETKLVDMMFHNYLHGYLYDPILDADIVERVYLEGKASMIIVVPRDIAGISTLESQLTPGSFQNWTSQIVTMRLELYLPRFSLQDETALAPVVDAMGMGTMFTDGADFSDLTKNVQNLKVSELSQKTTLEVNEVGSRAAAATALRFFPYSPVPVVRADRPFLFYIYDTDTGLILFTGRVADPDTSP